MINDDLTWADSAPERIRPLFIMMSETDMNVRLKTLVKEYKHDLCVIKHVHVSLITEIEEHHLFDNPGRVFSDAFIFWS